MKPIMQTDFTFKTGNCGEACIASILEIALSDIPLLHNPKDPKDSHTYCKNLRLFLSKYELSYIDIEFNENNDPIDFLKDCWILATGPSPRGSKKWHRHGVVWRNGEIVHDPHPSGDGLEKIELYGMFIEMNPSKHIKSIEESRIDG